MSVLDLSTVQAFLTVVDLASFTRAAEALGTTQAAVSMKVQKLESTLGKRLLERSPRAIRLTADGARFRDKARALMDAHDRARDDATPQIAMLKLGISDHAAGPELVPILEQLKAAAPALSLSVTIGLSRQILDLLDSGDFDAVIVRKEGSRRGGETLCTDSLGWFAAPRLQLDPASPIPLATLAAPCGVHMSAVRALDQAGLKWTEAFSGGGLTAVTAATTAGLGVAPLAKRIAPPGLVDVGAQLGLPALPSSTVVMHSRVSDHAQRAALRILTAAFRQAVKAGG